MAKSATIKKMSPTNDSNLLLGPSELVVRLFRLTLLLPTQVWVRAILLPISFRNYFSLAFCA